MNLKVYQPQSLEEALEILGKFGKDTFILAGGTDLMVKWRNKLIEPKILMDIANIDRLKFIYISNGIIHIGATTTFSEILEFESLREKAPLLLEAIKTIASPGIRNLATIGGNIANASPVADSVPPLIALNAMAIVKSKNRTRKLLVENIATGPGITVLQKNELITEILFEQQNRDEIYFFKKLGQRKAQNIAKVSVTVRIIFDKSDIVKDAKVVLGAVAPKVIRAKKAEKFIIGKKLTKGNIETLAELSSKEATPITDLRSTKIYRKKMVAELIYRNLIEKL